MPRKKDPPDHKEGYTICVKCKCYRHNHDEYEVVNSLRMYTCIFCCKRNKKLKELIMKEKEEEKPIENKLENLILEKPKEPETKEPEPKEEEPKEEEPIEEVKVKPNITTIIYTKCVNNPNMLHLLNDVVVSNIDLFNLQNGYTIEEKIIELIKEEYDQLGVYEKPIYTFNKKKQIIFIKGKLWNKISIDDDNIIKGIIDETIIKKIKDRCIKRNVELNLSYDLDDIYDKLLEMGDISME